MSNRKRYRTRHKENKKMGKFVLLVVVLLATVVAVKCVDYVETIDEYNDKIAQVNEQIDEEEERSVEIENLAAEIQTRAFIEKTAREMFNMVYDDEIIFEKESN